MLLLSIYVLYSNVTYIYPVSFLMEIKLFQIASKLFQLNWLKGLKKTFKSIKKPKRLKNETSTTVDLVRNILVHLRRPQPTHPRDVGHTWIVVIVVYVGPWIDHGPVVMQTMNQSWCWQQTSRDADHGLVVMQTMDQSWCRPWTSRDADHGPVVMQTMN